MAASMVVKIPIEISPFLKPISYISIRRKRVMKMFYYLLSNTNSMGWEHWIRSRLSDKNRRNGYTMLLKSKNGELKLNCINIHQYDS